MFKKIPWQDVCKFLAGAFFVNAGILFYLYLARVSVPLLGTNFIETPEISGRALHRAYRSLPDHLPGFIESGKAIDHALRQDNQKNSEVDATLMRPRRKATWKQF